MWTLLIHAFYKQFRCHGYCARSNVFQCAQLLTTLQRCIENSSTTNVPLFCQDQRTPRCGTLYPRTGSGRTLRTPSHPTFPIRQICNCYYYVYSYFPLRTDETSKSPSENKKAMTTANKCWASGYAGCALLRVPCLIFSRTTLLQFHNFPTLPIWASISKSWTDNCPDMHITSLTTSATSVLDVCVCLSVAFLTPVDRFSTGIVTRQPQTLFLFLAAQAVMARQQFLQVATRQPVLVSFPAVLPLPHVCAAIPRSVCEFHRTLRTRALRRSGLDIPSYVASPIVLPGLRCSWDIHQCTRTVAILPLAECKRILGANSSSRTTSFVAVSGS